MSGEKVRNKSPKIPGFSRRKAQSKISAFEREREKGKTRSNDLQKSRNLNQGLSTPKRSFSQRIFPRTSSHHHQKK
jgi:hypothetical protein